MRTFLVTPSATGIKSIPLQNLPESAWQTLVGQGSGNSGDVLDRYEDIPWLHRGVEARCNALKGMPVKLHVGDEDGDELASSDWPFDINIRALLDAVYRDYILYGRAYVFINYNVMGGMLQGGEFLRRFLPTSVTPVYDEASGIVGWKRTIGSRLLPPFPKEAIAYWYKPPTRTESGWGVSDAAVALKAAGVIHNTDEYAGGYFERGAINPTLVSIEGEVSEPDKERVQSWVSRTITGIANAFRVSVIGGKLSSTTLGYPMKDLVAVELTNQKREDIATALGVPQSVLFSNAANYATALQDDLHFYDKTVKPDSDSLAEILNRSIFHPLGYHLSFHPERLEVYQRLEVEKAGSLKELTEGERPIMTVREARQRTDLSPLPAEDDPQYAQFTGTDTPREVSSGDTVSGTATPDNATTELKAWRTMAQNRLKEGKPHKALAFRAQHLPPALVASIKGGLETAVTPVEVARVFAGALVWSDYP